MTGEELDMVVTERRLVADCDRENLDAEDAKGLSLFAG
jgi:hypothetical protein